MLNQVQHDGQGHFVTPAQAGGQCNRRSGFRPSPE